MLLDESFSRSAAKVKAWEGIKIIAAQNTKIRESSIAREGHMKCWSHEMANIKI